MATVVHEPLAQPRPQWAEFLRIREMWASVAISVMWLAVLFVGVSGSEFVASNGAGTQTTTIPSGIFVAFFAFLGTASVMKWGFGRAKQ